MASIAKLVAELNLDGSGFDKGLGFARKSLGGFGKALAIAIPIAAITGIGVALFKVGDAYDAMSDSIAIKTGATGDALKALQGDAVDVFKTVPTTMQIAGDAIASISAKTGDTGKNLRDLTASEIELARVTGTDLNGNIDASTKLFNAFGVSAKNQTKTLDQIFTASQKSGVGVDQLMAEVQQFNPVLRAMGLGAGASANLIGKLDKSGLHTTVVMQGFKKSLGVFAKQGVSDVKAGLTDVFNGIKNAGSSADATAIAMKYFGAKAGPELAQAIRDGKISVDDLTGSVDKNGKSILDSAKGTYDFAENWTLLKNNIEAALIPLGTMVFQGLNLLIPLLTDGVKAIGTFATAMGDAFGSSAKVSDLIKQFPDWLQPAAKALLLVADAAGDVARGFSTGGLAGAFDALGPAIKQALGALGSFAIDVVVDIGKFVLGKLPSLADWLDKQFGGTGALPAGDGTGGPDADGVNHIPISQLVVDVLGFTAGKVADLWGWVEGLFGVGSTSVVGDGTGGPDSDHKITIQDVVVNAAIRFSADWSKWDNDITKALGLDSNSEQMQAANQSGQTLGAAVAQQVKDGIAAGINGGGKDSGKGGQQSGGDDGVFATIKKILVWEPPFARGDNPSVIDDAFQWASGFGQGIHDKIVSGISAGLNGTASPVAGIPILGATQGNSGGLAGWLNEMGSSISGAIKSMLSFDLSGIAAPHLPDWVTHTDDWLGKPLDYLNNLLDGLGKAIHNKIMTILGLKDEAASLLSGGYGSISPNYKDDYKSGYTENRAPSTPNTGNNDQNAIPQGLTNRIVIPAPDHGAFDKVLSDLGAQVKTFATTTYTAKFDIDTGPAAIKYTDASTWGDVWSKQNFVALFSIDDGPAAVSYTDAFGWGTIWDAATFTSTFGIDNGPAAIAYTDAYSWGDTWDGAVFTARITVDTSALDAAEFVVATKMASIRALLPSSPAKKGPFSKLPTFDWLHDNLASTMGRMQDTATNGMASLAGAFNGNAAFGLAGNAGNGSSVNVTVAPGAVVVHGGQFVDVEALGVHIGQGIVRELGLRNS